MSLLTDFTGGVLLPPKKALRTKAAESLSLGTPRGTELGSANGLQSCCFHWKPGMFRGTEERASMVGNDNGPGEIEFCISVGSRP